MNKTKAKLKVLGMKDYSPGVQTKLSNMTPSAKKIANFISKFIKE